MAEVFLLRARDITHLEVLHEAYARDNSRNRRTSKGSGDNKDNNLKEVVILRPEEELGMFSALRSSCS